MSKEECINFLMSLNYDFFKNFDVYLIFIDLVK